MTLNSEKSDGFSEVQKLYGKICYRTAIACTLEPIKTVLRKIAISLRHFVSYGEPNIKETFC